MGAVVLGRLTQVPRSRLVGWAILVTALALLSYAANLADTGDTPDDLLFQWSSAVGGLIQYAIILGIVLAIARGLAPATLGLVRPASWARAAGRIATALVSIWVIGAVLNVFLEAGKEQGLVPDSWDSGRAAPFVANFVVVAGVAPVVEELTYRGLGFAAVRDAFGNGAAVVVTALAFGLAHGLFVALPVLTIFGLILAWVRLTTGSIYPTIALHALFNGIALIAAVTV
jgi:membrane protease YdiL (CAAX protease family)